MKEAKMQNFNLYSVNEEKFVITKPIYVGFCVLELSKLIMFDNVLGGIILKESPVSEKIMYNYFIEIHVHLNFRFF